MADTCQRGNKVHEQVDILDVRVDCVNFAETLNLIEQWIECPTPQSINASRPIYTRQICTVNPEFVIDAKRDPIFARVLSEADLRVADGVGILWAAQLFGTNLKERVTGSDGIYQISERAAEREWRVFLLGAAPGVAEKTADTLRKQYPTLAIVGTCSGTPQVDVWPQIQAQLVEADPDLLFVAFGHPQQELWISEHRHELGAKVAIGVGGAFDFVAGVLPRAPKWMRAWGLEWLYRLLLQPTRARRMLKLPVFVLLALKSRYLTGTGPA